MLRAPIVTDVYCVKGVVENVEMKRWCLYIHVVLSTLEGVCLFLTVTPPHGSLTDVYFLNFPGQRPFLISL